jgi:tetratricopeptide (TPR) repeat protein
MARRTFRALVAAPLAFFAAGCFGGSNAVPPLTPAERLNQEGLRRLYANDTGGAEESFRRALAEAELRDDLRGEAEAWNNLGALARERGAAEEALAFHRKALALHGQAGGRAGPAPESEARTRTNIGAALLALGHTSEAKAEFERAVALWAKLEHRAGLARAKASLALAILREAKEAKLALALAREAKTLAEDAEDDAGRAAALGVEGAALEAAGDLAAAREAYEAALEIDKARGAPAAIAEDLHALGRICERTNDAARAAGFYARASRVLRRMGNLDQCERDLEKAAALARASGRAAEAGECEAELRALRNARAEGRLAPP